MQALYINNQCEHALGPTFFRLAENQREMNRTKLDWPVSLVPNRHILHPRLTAVCTHLERFGGAIGHGQGTGEEPRGGAEQIHFGHLVHTAVLCVVPPICRLYQEFLCGDPLQLLPSVAGHW